MLSNQETGFDRLLQHMAFYGNIESEGEMKPAKTLALGVILALATVSGAAMADGDPAKGEKIYKKCKTCHSLEAGKSKIGPSLAGVMGRTAGTAEGFKKFSKAMKESGVVWSEETLGTFLADPKGTIPGNKMTFPGLKKEGDQKDVVAYLKQAAQ